MKQYSTLPGKPNGNLFLHGRMLLSALVFFSCANNTGKTSQAATPAAPETFTAFKVIAQTATLQTGYPATLQGEQNIEIRPKIDGFIDKIYVDCKQAATSNHPSTTYTLQKISPVVLKICTNILRFGF